jgi:hypothetical protein
MPQLPFAELTYYEDKWVALSKYHRKIVGSGSDAVEATQDAAKHGHNHVTLFYVPRADAFFIGHSYGV